MVTYAADSHELYGALYFKQAADHPPGAKRKIHDWDSGKYLGEIPQVRHTFRVVGNMNEHQVAIGETTFGGRKELKNPKGGIDYGSLIYVTLERARTAREAIKVMTELVAVHGYYSGGESFSIADPKEVWLLEMIGKGPGEKGAVWVARKVPDGYVCAHANQPRIHSFPKDDPENCLYAKDVISFARKKGYFKGKDEDFSFHDAYAPPTCRDKRVRDGRVWAMYRRVAPSLKIPIDYVMCKPNAKPLPLWIKPEKNLSVRDVMELMRDHFEGTPLDLRKGVGAGPYALPYRWRPLTWKVDGDTYVNERATATQQTGFSFVSQSRAFLPDPVGGVLWFSVDDAASTVYVPMYAGIQKAPKPYAFGTASFTKFSWDSAFWVFNWVSNFAYSRYKDMIKDIRQVQQKLERDFIENAAEVEKKAVALHKQSPKRARAFLTRYSTDAANRVVERWKRLGQELLMKYLDGNVRDAKGKVTHPGYPKQWYKRIVAERGDHFLVKRGKDKKGTKGKKSAKGKTGKKGQAEGKASGSKKGGADTQSATAQTKEKKIGCQCRAPARSKARFERGPVGSFGWLFLLAGGIFWWRRKRMRKHTPKQTQKRIRKRVRERMRVRSCRRNHKQSTKVEI
jgi:dipeptidase